MENIRLAPAESVFPRLPCSRCADGTRFWDRVAGKTFCPQCQEALAVGEGSPLIERPDKRRCAVCHRVGTLRYLTFPLRSRRPLKMDLCANHLRALLGRKLGSSAFVQIRRKLDSLNLDVADVFLLHDAFYDLEGKAIQPVAESY